MAKEPTITEMVDNLRSSITDDLEALVKEILQATSLADQIEVLGNAIVDGRCDEWLIALRMATVLEETRDNVA